VKDTKKLAPKFVIKTFTLKPNIQEDEVRLELCIALKKMFKEERLELIGGYQDPKNMKNLILFCFQLDKLPVGKDEAMIFT